MVKVGIIVLISASYSGIFSHTCLLSGVKHALLRSARRLTPFGTVLVTSVLSCAVSCNQSLATILTCQMCDGLYPKKEKLALALEDTAILIAALIPWGIAGTVPVAAIGAPMGCMFYAFYLYLVPLWNLITALYHDRIRAGRTAFTSFM
jgi:NhaC family Na+:H+ antiporter